MTSAPTEQALRAAWERQRLAMLAADTDALDELLSDDFTLTHMTGYVQPKEEWLDHISTGQMTYHSIVDVNVSAQPSAWTVTARSKTSATIWGLTGTWNLALTITFAEQSGALRAVKTVATTWR